VQWERVRSVLPKAARAPRAVTLDGHASSSRIGVASAPAGEELTTPSIIQPSPTFYNRSRPSCGLLLIMGGQRA
jgi:hypothetical protein